MKLVTSKDKTFYIDDNIKYVNWSEGHLYNNSLWFSREAYLRKVAYIIQNGYPIVRDGTKTIYNSSFKLNKILRRFSNKEESINECM